MKTTEKKPERQIHFDLLRILACFMVVVLHAASRFFDTTPVEAENWMAYNAYDALVRSAVPLFVMLSGVFFLAPERRISLRKLYRKSIGRIALAYVVWSAVYTVYDVWTGAVACQPLYVLQAWIAGPKHLWYIPMLIGLYVISPLLKKITERADRDLIRYGIVVFLVAAIVKTLKACPFLPGAQTIVLLADQIPTELVLLYSSYFLLGWFLTRCSFSKTQKRILYGTGVLCPVVCALLTALVSRQSGEAYADLYNNFTIFTALEAVAVFVFFKDFTPSVSARLKAWIHVLSQCTLGIYLTHILVLRILASQMDLQAFAGIWMVPSVSVVVFALSFVLTWSLRKIKGVRALL